MPILRAEEGVDSVGLAVWLVTPSFASWLDPANPFLARSMNRLFQHVAGPDKRLRHCNAILAVVDRLPAPGKLVPNVESSANKSTRRFESFEEGHEGLAFQLTSTNDDTVRTSSGVKSGPIWRSNRYLTFVMRERSVYEEPWVTYGVSVPLANTTFVNGRESTMVSTRWEKDVSSQKIILIAAGEITDPSIHLALPLRGTSSLDVPLHRLTERRKVVSSMGNIIRQLAGRDESSSPIPASSELEGKVTELMNTRDQESGRFDIWALVERTFAEGACKETTDGPNAPKEIGDDHISEAIHRGARLHRVMSGGGGWGSRQGLLSLDPAFQLRSEKPIDASSIHDAGLFDEHGKIPLEEVAKPGDFISFYMTLQRERHESSEKILPSATDKKLQRPPYDENMPRESFSRTFGVMPKSDPSSSTSNLSEPTGRLTGKLVEFRNHFGVLSEEGIFMRIQRCKPAATKKRKTVEGIGMTKIDVPFSRLDIVGSTREL